MSSRNRYYLNYHNFELGSHKKHAGATTEKTEKY